MSNPQPIVFTLNQDSLTAFEQGAHLCSWKHRGKEQLFLSDAALFKPGVAIRGGVPLIFPQFGEIGQGKKHGFARNVIWQKSPQQPPNGISFYLQNSAATEELWPHTFTANYIVTLNHNTLSMRLEINNTGSVPFSFTGALHTYLLVEEIETCQITGLHGCNYWDNGTHFNQRQQETNANLHIHSAIDRVYFDVNKELTLKEPKQTRRICGEGFNDIVIWNPWREAADAFADMHGDEYNKMLCIESATVDKPITLTAGQTWCGQQSIEVLEEGAS